MSATTMTVCMSSDRHIHNHREWAWVPSLVGPRRARCMSCGRTRRALPGERLLGDPEVAR